MSLGRILSKVGLNNILDLVDPSFLEIIADLGGARFLDLLELIDPHALGDVGVVNVLNEHVVTLLPNLLHSTNGLVFVQYRVEAEV